MSKYIRTTLKTFNELPQASQEAILKDVEQSDAQSTEYIQDPCDKESYLPLSEFMTAGGSKLWSGFFGQSYFSGYFIKIARDGETATIGYRHW